jgi:peptide/nickel transport system substrate-binding protein
MAANPSGAIHSPAAIEEYGDAYGTDAIVGTGPFEFVEWTGPLGEFTVVRNEDYNWASPIYNHQGPPYLEGFTVKGIVEAGTRRSGLEAGSLDISYLAESDYPQFKDREGYETKLFPKQGTARILNFNVESPILKDIRVRKAIVQAIDREALLQAPAFGQGVPDKAYSFISEATWGSDTQEEFGEYCLSYDPESARALLEEAGWRDEDGDGVREAYGVEGVEDGTPLVLEEAVNANVREKSVLIQGMLAEVGIKDEMIVEDFATMHARRVNGNYDFSIFSNSGSDYFVMAPFFDSREIDSNNMARYENPEIDQLIDEAAKTVDPAEQKEIFREIQMILLEDLPAHPMWYLNYPYAYHEGVQDVKVDSNGIGVYLYDTYVEGE